MHEMGQLVDVRTHARRARVGLPMFVTAIVAAFGVVAGAQDVMVDFSTPASMQAFGDKASAQYRQSDQPGVKGDKGRLDSLNSGDQSAGLFVTSSTYDLRRQTLQISTAFEAQAADAGGVSRVFIGFANSDQADLAAGAAKIGVRVFKSASPKYPKMPWAFQLVNGAATRNIGQQFTLETGKWYRMTCLLGLADDQRHFTFEANLQELDDHGQPVSQGLQRTEKGTTQRLEGYTLNPMYVGLVGQNQHGGAKAFDDLSIKVVATRASEGLDESIAAVTFIAPPMPADDRQLPGIPGAPAQTMFGVCGHFMHTDEFYPNGKFGDYWQPKFTLPLLIEARLGWVREPLYQPWFDNADKPNVLEHRKVVEQNLAMYQKRGVKVLLAPMVVMDGNENAPYRSAFFQWVAELAARYANVRVVEMHNEPNLKFFWQGTAADYARVYAEGAKLIKQARPDVQISVGVISSLWWKPGVDWLQAAIKAGVLDYADAVSVHPYNKKYPPEADPNFEGASPDASDNLEQALAAFYKWVEDQAPAGKKLKLYLTELGYSSAADGMAAVGDEVMQADYLSRLMLIYYQVRLTGVPIEGVFWYDLKNDGRSDHEESNYGLVSYDLSRTKPAYETYRRIAEYFADPDQWKTIALPVQSSNLPQAVKCFTWRRESDGAIVIPFWRMQQRQASDVDFPTQLEIQLPANMKVGTVMLHSLREGRPRAVGYELTDGQLRVPVLAGRRAAWLEIRKAGDGD